MEWLTTKKKEGDRGCEHEGKVETHRHCDLRLRRVLCTNKQARTPADVPASGWEAADICLWLAVGDHGREEVGNVTECATSLSY